MSCDQFDRRMDALLDQRRSLAQDEALQRHARQCPHCAARLDTWLKIDQALRRSGEVAAPAPAPQPQGAPGDWKRTGGMLLALTAGLMLWVTARWAAPDRSARTRPAETSADAPPPRFMPRVTVALPSQPDSRSPRSELPLPEQEVAAPHPSEGGNGRIGTYAFQEDWSPAEAWWDAVSDDFWTAGTIPAVNSVRQGVAPLGRSMRRALAILMSQTDPPALDSRGRSPELGREGFDEQTSLDLRSTRPPNYA